MKSLHMTAHVTKRTAALTAFALMAAVAGCSDSGAAADDSTLAHDLVLAGQVAMQPTFEDTVKAEEPAPPPAKERTPEPTPQPRRATPPRKPAPKPVVTPPAREPERQPAQTPAPAPAPAPVALIASGATVDLTSGMRVCTNTSRPGDKLVGTVNSAVVGSNGALIPAGSHVVLEVASVAADQSDITLRVRALVVGDSTYPLQADVRNLGEMEHVAVAGQSGSDKKKVIGGAIAGAILGQVLGKDTKSTVIGAATGAAAGAIAARATQKTEACLPAGAPLRLVLTHGLAM